MKRWSLSVLALLFMGCVQPEPRLMPGSDGAAVSCSIMCGYETMRAGVLNLANGELVVLRRAGPVKTSVDQATLTRLESAFEAGWLAPCPPPGNVVVLDGCILELSRTSPVRGFERSMCVFPAVEVADIGSTTPERMAVCESLYDAHRGQPK